MILFSLIILLNAHLSVNVTNDNNLGLFICVTLFLLSLCLWHDVFCVFVELPYLT